MIRRNKIIASVAVSVMAGVLVAGNLAPLQGYYAFAQETGVKAGRYSAVKDINKTLEGYTPMDSHMPLTVTTQCSDSTAAVHLQLRT